MADEWRYTDAPPSAWQSREIVRALQRLATARANLALLEEQAQAPPPVQVDPVERARIERRQAVIEDRRRSVGGGLGHRAARRQLGELEEDQRQALWRLGFADFRQFAAVMVDADHRAVSADPAALAFARQEAAAAERDLQEILRLEMPAAEDAPDRRDRRDGRDGRDGRGGRTGRPGYPFPRAAS